MNYSGAAAIGAISGLRSMSGPAFVSQAAARHAIDLRNTPLSWLGSGNGIRASAILAIGEFVVDKLPSVPDRTSPPVLIARAVSGAVCAYAMCGKRCSKPDRWIAAAVGATAAMAAAWAGVQYRKRVKLPPLLSGIIEDGVTIGSGAVLMSAIGH
jgi:uncharacterized membrane protein